MRTNLPIICAVLPHRGRRGAVALLSCCLLWLVVACGSTPGSAVVTPAPTATSKPTATPEVPGTATPLLTYSGHVGPVIGVAWSPDNTRIASCGNDGTVQVWAVESGNLLWKTRIGHYAFAVAWSPDGRKIAGGAGDGNVTLLDASNGQQLAAYTDQSGAIEGLAWSPDSTFIVAGSQDKTADVWNVRTGKRVLSYTGHSAAVARVAWSPDGKHIASASYDGTVQVWDASTGKRLLSYSGNGAPVWSVAWSPDGKHIVSGTGAAGAFPPVRAQNTVKIWDPTTGQTVLTYTGTSDQYETYALAWSPDSQSIVSAGDDQIIPVWNATTGKDLFHYQGQSQGIFGLAWSADGTRIASAGIDGTVQIWKPQT